MALKDDAPLGSKLSYWLTIGTQWAKEKLGSAQSSPLPASFIETVKLFRSNSEELKDLHAKMSKLLQCERDYGESFDRMQDSMAAFATHLDKQESCGRSVQAFVTAQNTLHRSRTKVQEIYRRLLFRPIDVLLKGEVAEGEELKAQCDQLHLAFDACGNRLSEAKAKGVQAKIEKAEADVREVTEQFEKVKAQLLAKCDIVEQKKNAILSHNLSYYMQAEINFYGEAYRAYPSDSLPDGAAKEEGNPG